MRFRSRVLRGAEWLLLVLGLTSCTPSGSPTAAGRTAAAQDFEDHVRPLFEHRCVWCHNRDAPLAGLNFQDSATLFAKESRFVVPGHPEKSRIYLAVTRSFKHPMVMPGDGWGISESYRNGIKRWIEGGAPWPTGAANQIRRLSYEVEIEDL